MQIDILRIEPIAPMQMDCGPGRLKHEVGELQIAIAQLKLAAQCGEHVRDLLVVGLPLRPPAQHIDFVLHRPARKQRSLHLKPAVEQQPLVNRAARARVESAASSAARSRPSGMASAP